MIIRNGIYSFLSTFVNLLSPLVLLPIVTKALSIEALGAVLYYESVARYLAMFLLLGIPTYGVREISREKKDRFEENSRLISWIIQLQLVLVIISVLIYILFFDVTLINTLTLMLTIFSALSFEWALQGLENFKIIAVRNILLRSTHVILTYFFVKDESDDILYLVLIVFTNIILTLWNLYTLKSYISLKFKIDKSKFYSFIKPIFVLFGSSILISVYTLFDVVLLGELSNNEQVAIYNIGIKLPKAATIILTSFIIVFVPKLSYLFSVDKIRFNALLISSFRMVLLIGLPACLILFINSEIFLDILISRDGFSKSSMVMQILSFTPILIGLSNFVGIQILTTYGYERSLLIGAGIGAITSLLLNFLLIPKFGAVGASISNLSAEFIVLMVLVFIAQKKKMLPKVNMSMINIIFFSVVFTLFLLIIITLKSSSIIYYLNGLFIIGLILLRKIYQRVYQDLLSLR